MKRLLAAGLRKLGANKGAPRLYLEGNTPAKGGFTPGLRYTLERREEGNALVLRLNDEGTRVVSKKEKGGTQKPVIDLNSAEALAMFEGMESVRVLVGQGEIWILPLANEMRRRDRIRRMQSEIKAGVVSTAGIATGCGVMSNALHCGLKDAGLRPSMKWAIEIDPEAIEQAELHNEAWNDETLSIAMPLQEVGFSDDWVRRRLQPVTYLDAGLPCTAASVSGRSKKALAKPEDDGKAGHLVAGFIALLAQANPVAMTLENVSPYFSSSSAAILESQLVDMGYEVEVRTIEGADYAIEGRVRKVMIAITRGSGIQVADLVPPPRAVQTVGEILEDVPMDASCWSEMQYLKDKEVRDVAAGKGFRMAIATPADTTVGCLGTGYAKNRSTEPKIQHPENPDLLRLMTPVEHARVKGIPQHLIAGIESATRAHAFLGQSVIWPAFRVLGRVMGNALRDACYSVKPTEKFALA